jgi:cellulose synthase/poly-beta-1,6-N-acetylglucosamine synthase-like glycosyltransferase
VVLAIFWGAVLLLVYTYVGYPTAVYALGRLRPRPVHRDEFTPPVTVVIAAYNEGPRIARKLDSCLAQDYPAERLQVVVASDGSDDDTGERVRRLASPRVRLLAFETRRGKAACLNDAIAACQTDFVVLTDARQRLAPDAVRRLMGNFADATVGGVSGELVFEDISGSGFARSVDVYWRYERFLRFWEGITGSVVGVTGALYAIRKDCYRPIPPGTILDDVLVPMNIVMSGFRVGFDAGAKAYDQPSSDPAQERRRKRRTLAGNYQLLSVCPALLSPWRNHIWLRFVSHKLLRLVAPFAMAAALAANLVLAASSSRYATVLVAHIVFYALALAGAVWPSSLRFNAVRIPATFVRFNWFAVLGFVEFLRNRKAHLWHSRPDYTSAPPDRAGRGGRAAEAVVQGRETGQSSDASVSSTQHAAATQD